jgi:RNA polymerase sigma-70 factor (ECF subfamily)
VTKITDSQLLKLIKNPETSERGFRNLIEIYKERVYWHVRRMLIDHDDTDDVVQEVFIKVWKNIRKFKGDSEIYTWIYRIATNESIAFLKKKRRRALLSRQGFDERMMNRLDNEAFFTEDQNAIRFQRALLSLPDKQRLVFNMKYFDGLKYDKISEITGISTGGLKASYHHAVQKIKKELSEIKPFEPENIKQSNERSQAHRNI